MSVTETWFLPTSSPPDLTTGQTLTQQAWEMVLSSLYYLGGSNGAGGVVGGAPSGSFLGYGAGTSDPPGWLICDGRAVSRTTYASLFNVIGTSYGTGDGSTTFNIPDYRDRVLMGCDNAGTAQGAAGRVSSNAPTIGSTAGGEDTHALSVGELASHNHSHAHGVTDPNHGHNLEGYSGAGSGGYFKIDTLLGGDHTSTEQSATAGAAPYGVAGATGITIQTDATATGSGTGHNNRPLFLGANVIVKV